MAYSDAYTRGEGGGKSFGFPDDAKLGGGESAKEAAAKIASYKKTFKFEEVCYTACA